MVVMPANSSHAHTLDMVFPGRLGLIMCPSGKRNPKNLSWILDNEMYVAWANSGFSLDPVKVRDGWDSLAFLDMLTWACQQINKPRCVVVPDIPGNAKETLAEFCGECETVHVGRVNRYEKLWRCDDAGADSVDGSGFFRGDQTQQRGLIRYLKESAGFAPRQKQLSLLDRRIGVSFTSDGRIREGESGRAAEDGQIDSGV